MIRFCISDYEIFLDVINSFSYLNSSVNFTFKKDKLKISSMDRANISAYFLILEKDFFSDYEVSEEENIAINLKDLNPVIKFSKGKEKAYFEITKDQIILSVLGQIKKQFSFSILNEEESKIPNKDKLELPINFVIETNNFKEGIDSLSCLGKGDNISFLVKNHIFVLEKDEVLKKGNIYFEEINIQSNDIKSKYNYEYLNNFMLGLKRKEFCTLSFGEDMPLCLEAEGDNYLIKYILAPIVDNK